MVEFADSSFQRAIGGGASGIRMVPQAREVVVRMCVGGVLRDTICSKPRHGKG
jgi:type II secretory ATPase GspE/PulE/Tfp pilus assembly ATPase PilB-like protein